MMILKCGLSSFRFAAMTNVIQCGYVSYLFRSDFFSFRSQNKASALTRSRSRHIQNVTHLICSSATTFKGTVCASLKVRMKYSAPFAFVH